MGIRVLGRRSSLRSLPQVSQFRLLPRVSLPLSLMAIAGATLAAASSTGATARPNGVTGVAARTISLNLTTTAHLIGRPGHVAYAKGTISGTFTGTTSVRYVAVSSLGGETTFTIYPKSGGSLYGKSITRGRAVGATAYFSGTSTVTGGTGRWAHAHGTNLKFSGTVDRQNYHSTSVLRGSISV